jgi:hypothetical protein
VSDYDQRIHDAMMHLGGWGVPASAIATRLGRPVKGMDAGLRAATGRIDWLMMCGGLWYFTNAEMHRIREEQRTEELDAERHADDLYHYRDFEEE